MERSDGTSNLQQEAREVAAEAATGGLGGGPGLAAGPRRCPVLPAGTSVALARALRTLYEDQDPLSGKAWLLQPVRQSSSSLALASVVGEQQQQQQRQPHSARASSRASSGVEVPLVRVGGGRFEEVGVGSRQRSSSSNGCRAAVARGEAAQQRSMSARGSRRASSACHDHRGPASARAAAEDGKKAEREARAQALMAKRKQQLRAAALESKRRAEEAAAAKADLEAARAESKFEKQEKLRAWLRKKEEESLAKRRELEEQARREAEAHELEAQRTAAINERQQRARQLRLQAADRKRLELELGCTLASARTSCGCSFASYLADELLGGGGGAAGGAAGGDDGSPRNAVGAVSTLKTLAAYAVPPSGPAPRCRARAKIR